MSLTKKQEATILRWISAVETGNPNGDYGKVTVYADGPEGQMQITYGRYQTTETGGNLKALIKEYYSQCYAELCECARLQFFLHESEYACVNNPRFINLLRKLGSDPCMQKVQDEFFRAKYFTPADRWAEKNGFHSALSHLVIYDSFIHSGGIPAFLRKRFSEVPPAQGGDERKWIARYVETRHQWLKHWGNGKDGKSIALRASKYRTQGLLDLIDAHKWDLQGSISVNGIKIT